MFLNIPDSRLSPQDSTRRLMYLVILMMITIINSVFQTRLSSINVATHIHKTMDTMDDLIKSNLFVYGTLSYKELFSEKTVSQRRYQLSEYPDCLKRLKRNEQVVCIPGCIEARFSAYDGENFHISKKELMMFFMVFSTREDWPLLTRFNQIIRKLSEAGFINLFRRRETSHFMRNPDDRNKAPKISVQSLKFGFVLLLSGLSLGVVCLIIEIIACCAKSIRFKKIDFKQFLSNTEIISKVFKK